MPTVLCVQVGGLEQTGGRIAQKWGGMKRLAGFCGGILILIFALTTGVVDQHLLCDVASVCCQSVQIHSNDAINPLTTKTKEKQNIETDLLSQREETKTNISNGRFDP